MTLQVQAARTGEPVGAVYSSGAAVDASAQSGPRLDAEQNRGRRGREGDHDTRRRGAHRLGAHRRTGQGRWHAAQAIRRARLLGGLHRRPHGAMVMGDTVVFQDEVTPAMDAAFAHGLEVTGLHNHFFYDEPKVYFMHIGGRGEPEKLAAGVKAVWDAIKKVRAAERHA